MKARNELLAGNKIDAENATSQSNLVQTMIRQREYGHYMNQESENKPSADTPKQPLAIKSYLFTQAASQEDKSLFEFLKRSEGEGYSF